MFNAYRHKNYRWRQLDGRLAVWPDKPLFDKETGLFATYLRLLSNSAGQVEIVKTPV